MTYRKLVAHSSHQVLPVTKMSRFEEGRPFYYVEKVKYYVCSSGIDSWINLSCVNPDEEVQGEIYLELHIMQDQHKCNLHCHVLEAR